MTCYGGDCQLMLSPRGRHIEALHEDCHGAVPCSSRAASITTARRHRQSGMGRMIRQRNDSGYTTRPRTLVATAAIGDRVELLRSYEVVQDACNGCHQTFRLPDH